MPSVHSASSGWILGTWCRQERHDEQRQVDAYMTINRPKSKWRTWETESRAAKGEQFSSWLTMAVVWREHGGGWQRRGSFGLGCFMSKTGGSRASRKRQGACGEVSSISQPCHGFTDGTRCERALPASSNPVALSSRCRCRSSSDWLTHSFLPISVSWCCSTVQCSVQCNTSDCRTQT